MKIEKVDFLEQEEVKDAIAYLVKNFKSYGLKPGLGDLYTQPFDIQTDIQIGDGNYFVINKDTMIINSDYLPLFFSSNGTFSGEAVFVGYGFQINEKELEWDDYANIDVER